MGSGALSSGLFAVTARVAGEGALVALASVRESESGEEIALLPGSAESIRSAREAFAAGIKTWKRGEGGGR